MCEEVCVVFCEWGSCSTRATATSQIRREAKANNGYDGDNDDDGGIKVFFFCMIW